ncbi:MAG: hypothetical protein U9N53_06780, partial [Bacteroidota bacterium]|nr:hypothetical protein [Bacteroidota bacterium]
GEFIDVLNVYKKIKIPLLFSRRGVPNHFYSLLINSSQCLMYKNHLGIPGKGRGGMSTVGITFL